MSTLRYVQRRAKCIGVFTTCVVAGLWITNAIIFNPAAGEFTHLEDLQPVVTPLTFHDIHGGESVFLIILVTSATGNFNARHTIRQTWGRRTSLWSARVRIIFMLGTTTDPETTAKLKEEIAQHGDLLIGNFEDSYQNLPLKSFMSLKWALDAGCQYIAKTDDDMYVHTPRLLEFLQGTKVHRLYAGRVRPKATVIRFRFHRYSVPYESFKETFYPPYCYGGFYIVSRNVLSEMFKVSGDHRPFPAEDAYIGVLARDIGLVPIDLSNKILLVKSTYWTEINVNCIDNESLSNALVIGDSLKPQLIIYMHRRVAVRADMPTNGRCELYARSNSAKVIFTFSIVLLCGILVSLVFVCCKAKSFRRRN